MNKIIILQLFSDCVEHGLMLGLLFIDFISKLDELLVVLEHAVLVSAVVIGPFLIFLASFGALR